MQINSTSVKGGTIYHSTTPGDCLSGNLHKPVQIQSLDPILMYSINDLGKKKHSSYHLRIIAMNIEFPSPKSEIGRLPFRRRAAIAWISLPGSTKKLLNCRMF